MKISKSKFKATAMVGGLLGGVVAEYGGGLLPDSLGKTTNAAIVGVVGAAVDAFSGKSDLMGGIGMGMLGVAGAQLTKSLVGTDTVGLLPGQNAVMGVKKKNWVASRQGGSSVGEKNPLPNQSVFNN